MTKTQQLLVALTAADAVLLPFSPTHPHVTTAQGVASVIRGRALEIVDEHGHVGGEIKVRPAQPNLKMPDGTIGFPEIVELRLISSQNRPHVKLGTSEDGGGLGLGGDTAYTQLHLRGTDPFIKIVNKDGRERTIRP